MKLRNALISLAGVALATTALSVAAQGKSGNIVCWKDASGKVIGCGDKVPQEFLNRSTTEFDKRGNVRKQGESAEEAAKRQAQEKELALAKEEELKRRKEQKRQDDALLNTFTNEKEIDLKRDREVQALNNFITQQTAALKGANDRLGEARKRAETFEKDKKALPPVVKEDLARAEGEKTRIETDIASNEKAKTDTITKYAEYRRRYMELKGLAPAATATPASAAAPAAPAAAAAPSAPAAPAPAKK